MMCRGDPSYQGLKGPDSTPYAPSGLGLNQAAALAEYHQRLQLLDYSRLRLHPFLPYAFPADAAAASAGPYGFPSPFVRFDPRRCLAVEEPKPQHSYIGLIAMAILSIPDKKMVLSDIYQYILDQYPYFRNRGPGWRNSIRHNLSLNDCFVKAGRSANGKGHYWAIHPANVEDFKKGDFRRRKAQRKVRKHMGLAVPDDDDSPAPSPPLHQPRRRFDMESLLAPDSPKRPLPAAAPPPQWGHPVGFVGQYAPSCWGAYPPGGQMSPQQAPQVSTIPTIQRWQQELRSASDPEPGKIDD